MKKFITAAFLLVFMCTATFSLVGVPHASAVDLFDGICKGQNDTSTDASGTDVCKDKDAAGTKNPVIDAISTTISILAVVIGVASVIVIILSGFRIMQSNGDSQKVATARSAIIYALVGVVIATIAGTIVTFVLSKL